MTKTPASEGSLPGRVNGLGPAHFADPDDLEWAMKVVADHHDGEHPCPACRVINTLHSIRERLLHLERDAARQIEQARRIAAGMNARERERDGAISSEGSP